VLWTTLTRFFAWPPAAAAAGLVAFVLVGASGAMVALPVALPGGIYYTLPLVVLTVVALVLLVRRDPAGPSYLAAAAVFPAALAARQLDQRLCAAFPRGTHFIWHSLAALLAFILIRAVILHAPPRRELPVRP